MSNDSPGTPGDRGWNVVYDADDLGGVGQGAQTGSGPRASGARRVLVVADEWFPARGGLSSLNRYLCAALATFGAEVHCLVPDASDDELDDAAKNGVGLLKAKKTPGTSEREALMRRPDLPRGTDPDLVIGHGRVTGPVAQALAEDHFPGAARFHFVHMAPDEIEWYKLDGKNDAGLRAEQRSRIELDLARDATAAVPVGPRLHAWLARDLPLGRDGKRAHLHQLNPGFDLTEPSDREIRPGRPLVMIMGRMEDVPLKGVDLAAKAFGHARTLYSGAADWELLVRGTPPGTERALRKKVLGWIGHPSATVTVRAYSPEISAIQEDLRRASLVLMPALVEGYGLVGHEAITAGTPALVSANSGLAGLVGQLVPRLVDALAVPVLHRDKKDVPVWGHRIAAIMSDREAAFARAADARGALAGEATWAMAVERLLAVL